MVAEHRYSSVDPGDLISVVKLILQKCPDFIEQEEIPLHQDSIELKKREFMYPAVAGRLEVAFGNTGTFGNTGKGE